VTWYLTRCITRQERAAHYNLQRKGFKVYCPFIYKDRRGHAQWQTEALWPGYLFTWLAAGLNDFTEVLRTPSITGFCYFGDGDERIYGTISNAEIDALQALADEHGIHGNRGLEYLPGDTVETTGDSAYRHYHGIVQKSEGERLRVLFEIAEFRKEITIDKKYIRPYVA